MHIQLCMQRQGAWSSHISDRVHKPMFCIPHRYNVFKCQSSTIPFSEHVIPLLRNTTLSLTRYCINLMLNNLQDIDSWISDVFLSFLWVKTDITHLNIPFHIIMLICYPVHTKDCNFMPIGTASLWLIRHVPVCTSVPTHDMSECVDSFQKNPENIQKYMKIRKKFSLGVF